MEETKTKVLHEQEVLEKLKNFDTPSITNVVATYPSDKENCLGLYHPWEGKWYTDQRLKCIFPEVGRKAGYVITCVYGMPDPCYTRLGFGDLLKAIENSPKPVVLAVKQNLPELIKNRNGLLGGNMMTAFKSMGVVGVISDGPSRDVDEIRPMGIQYMLTGICAGHGDFALQAVNVPVEICGMDVCPGEIVHMDENGAVKFPREKLDDVLTRAQRLQIIEATKQKLMSQTHDAEKIAKIMIGLYD
jgi:4-hydroxy-4-methyl-2-oxoglutarate aldolase